jgi:hypothetical protein
MNRKGTRGYLTQGEYLTSKDTNRDASCREGIWVTDTAATITAATINLPFVL